MSVPIIERSEDGMLSLVWDDERLTAEVTREVVEGWIDTHNALRARVTELEAALTEAREDVDHWAGYASDYFRDKWDLAGDLARIDRVLAERAEAAPGEQEQG